MNKKILISPYAPAPDYARQKTAEKNQTVRRLETIVGIVSLIQYIRNPPDPGFRRFLRRNNKKIRTACVISMYSDANKGFPHPNMTIRHIKIYSSVFYICWQEKTPI